ARAEKAARFAVAAINRALEGAEGTTALHTCFGYAHVVHRRPPGYAFFEELAGVRADQISIEAAQPRLDLATLAALPGKQLVVGVLDLADESPVEELETVVARIHAALAAVPPEMLLLAPDCGMKYLPRWKAFSKLRVLAEAAALVRTHLL
ncbi:MAG: 5-methyltetrahydropteroyltriglutamate--homocysteine methyltransferase, partial [Candidatus Dormibacterales bacterium]